MSLVTMIKKYMHKIKHAIHQEQGNTVEYDLKNYEPLVQLIKKKQQEWITWDDQRLQQLAGKLKDTSSDGFEQQIRLIEAFALVAEAMSRTIKLKPFIVQLYGALALYEGKCIEMQTGEGKTLVAVFPAFVKALTGKGVHVLTFNDYLAKRDAEWMRPVYHYLGLSVGIVQEGMTLAERQQAYRCEVTYATAKEAGFDFLRDTLVTDEKHKVQRQLHHAIIDEADSILIDEARVPLVIAGLSDAVHVSFTKLDQIVRQLKEPRDVVTSIQENSVRLTDEGLKRVEQLLDCGNLYDASNLELLTQLNCALQAEYLLQADKDYLVKNDTIEIIDEFTGRLADQRRWPDGLHAAVEAKENVAIKSKGRLLNTISLQHFLQKYSDKCGMTATAQSAAEELEHFYNLQITVIPPNKPSCRIDHADQLYRTAKEKQAALLREISTVHQSGQPVLIGTSSVQASQQLAVQMEQRGIACNVLNANQDELEAEIIAEAGRPGAVTISTNMAGRGTDIRLGGSDETEKKQVIASGGLYVIGTNRFESRRIDNQLRGRSGRQGEPGASRFFLSLDDELFVKYNIKQTIPRMMDKHNNLKTFLIQREMEHIQRRIEGHYLQIKTTLCKYSDLIEQQRIIIFEQRQRFLDSKTVLDFYKKEAEDHYARLSNAVTKEELTQTCRNLALGYLDQSWADYLAEIADVRESIHLSKVGGEDAMIAFHKIAIELFETCQQELVQKLIQVFEQVTIKGDKLIVSDPVKAPATTWTYLVHDHSFETMLGMQLTQDMGHAVYAGLMWPLLMLYPLLHRKKK